ncbi:MAG: DUF4864 domain-containing protein [Pseudomonadota bacterium]
MKRILAAIVLAFSFALPASADSDAVRGIISAQLDAFRDGDAARAYSFAAPQIRRMFPTPERFIAMVRQGYKPVYEAREPVFLRSQTMGDGTFAQEVSLTDAAGRSWTALYTLAQQDDGGWKITGCFLREAPGQNI